MRAYYLYGVKSKDYMELFRSKNLEQFFKTKQINDSEAAITLTMRYLSNYRIDHLFASDSFRKEDSVNIRYGPIYPQNLNGTEPFAALSVNDLQTEPKKFLNDRREKHYKYLTFIDKKDICQKEGEISYLDQIFGSKILSNEDIREIADEYQDFDEEFLIPNKISITDLEGARFNRDIAIVSLVVTALYQSCETRVIIRLKPEDQVIRRGLQLVRKIFSILPPLMAFNTAFSINENPQLILSQSESANTRLFILSGKMSDIDQSMFPKKALFIDLNYMQSDSLDKEFEDALLSWSKLDCIKRQDAMRVMFANANYDYFRRDFFIKRTNEFIDNPIWRYLENENQLSDNDDNDVLYDYLLKEYKSYEEVYYPVVKISWVEDLYKKRFCRNLSFTDNIHFLLPEDSWYSAVSILKLKLNLMIVEYDEEKIEVKANNCRTLKKWIEQLFSSPIEYLAVLYECYRIKQESEFQKYIDQIQSGINTESILPEKEKEAFRMKMEQEKADCLKNQEKQFQINVKKQQEECDKRIEQLQDMYEELLEEQKEGRKQDREKYKKQIDQLEEEIVQLRAEPTAKEEKNKKKHHIFGKKLK